MKEKKALVFNLISTLAILFGLIACVYMTGEYLQAKAEADRAEAEANAYFAERGL